MSQVFIRFWWTMRRRVPQSITGNSSWNCVEMTGENGFLSFSPFWVPLVWFIFLLGSFNSSGCILYSACSLHYHKWPLQHFFFFDNDLCYIFNCTVYRMIYIYRKQYRCSKDILSPLILAWVANIQVQHFLTWYCEKIT